MANSKLDSSPFPAKGRMGRRQDSRETNAASVVVDLIPTLNLQGRTLVIDDDADVVTPAVRKTDVDVDTWYRKALHGHQARPWVSGDVYEAIFVRYPVSRDMFTLLMHAAAPRLSRDGRMIVYGANDEGIKSVQKALEVFFKKVDVLATKKHSRVVCAQEVEASAFKRNLSDWKEKMELSIPLQEKAVLVSYPGLFAHGHLDGGTELLLKSLSVPTKKNARVLDYGCGMGIIGFAIQRTNPTIVLDLIDVDAIAIEAARENIPNATFFTSDGMDVVAGKTYDLIASNPPIHSGKGEDFTVLLRFLEKASRVLSKGGKMYVVVQATVPLQKHLTSFFSEVVLAGKDARYAVWRCSSPTIQGASLRHVKV
jgi:16S rRNA (guanine1207-N2)-methyltransferase